MSILNNTTVIGVVTQTQPATQPTHLIRLQEAQALLATLFKGAWSSGTTYTSGQMAMDGGAIYICKVATTLNQQPSATPASWLLGISSGTNGSSSYNYQAYASDASGTGFSLTPGSGLNYTAFLISSTVIASPNAGNFAGLWRLYVGANGTNGTNGTNVYGYIGYATDSSGTGFSLSPGGSRNFVAYLMSPTVIASPNAGNFAGLWKQYVGADGADGTNGTNGTSVYPYIGYASDTSGTGFSLTPGSGLNYVAFLMSSTVISSPNAANFTGLWGQYVSTGAKGDPGTNGSNGVSAYLYIGYAMDTSGTAFSLTPGPSLNYVAFLATNTFHASPVQADFAGLWKNYGANNFTVSGAITLSGGVLGLNAASAATNSYLVQRDSSGNCAANVVTVNSLVCGSATFTYASSLLTVNSALAVTALTVGSLGGVLKATAGVLAGSATTDDLTEGTTYKYFTNARVLATPLTGISSTNVILATDSILVAMGKIDHLLGGNYAPGTISGNLSINGALAVTGQTTLATSLSGILKAASGVVAGSATTSDLTEGSNLYWTQTRFNTALAAVAGQNNGIAPLDSSGKVPLTNLYAYGATTYGASGQSAMLLLSAAKQGDFCLRSDTNIAFVLGSGSPSILGSWAAWVYPVSSVNGATGAVTLTTTTVTEGTNLYFTNARADARIAAASGAASGICPLDSNSLVPAVNLPPVGNSIWTANSQSVQTNLSSALKGDLANRTDQNLTYILSNNTPGTFGNWVPLLYPVSSVNGATGTVVLTTTNVVEGTNLYFTTARVLATVLTGFAAGAGTVAGTDTVLGAFQKLQGTVATLVPLAGAVTVTGTLTHSAAVVFSGTANPGLIVNNLSTTQINALSSSNNGNIVYDTTAQQLKGLVNGTWVSLAASGAVPLTGGSGAPMTGALYFQDGLASNIVLGSTWSIRTSSSNANFDIQNSTTTALTVDSNNHVHAPNGHFDTPNGYYVSGTKVVTTQQAAIADFAAAGGWADAPAYTDFGNLVSKLNAALAMLRVHGLIAT